jgi:putative flippase GtrA
MFNRFLKVWLFLGWCPLVVFLKQVLGMRMYEDEFYFISFVVHPVIILAINYIVNKKLTLWYKEPEGD